MSATIFINSDATKRKCLRCEHPITGRSDKKFCDDYCRSAYYYVKKESMSIVRCINHILKRNRDILKDILGNRTIIEVDKRVLAEMDFNFNYNTHYRKNTKGGTTFFTYEYAFKLVKNARVVICKTKNLPDGRCTNHKTNTN